ncbi:MAG: SURF1 family protein [Hyphomicrobiaceae bacterium]
MRSRISLTIFALGALAVLIGLGTWQMQRLAWKRDLIAKIEARTTQTPLDLADVLRRRQETGDIEYLPVRLEGTYQHERARHVYALYAGKPAWHVYTPLKTGEGRYVFVNRGAVPDTVIAAGKALDIAPVGRVVVTGLVRQPPATTSAFTPGNEPERNRFYWRDFTNMVASIHDKTDVSFAPFFIDQAAPANGSPAGWPRAGTTRVRLPNRHLEYAITWYGLALALAGVYGFFVLGRMRDEVE